jgi:hypothetical protein
MNILEVTGKDWSFLDVKLFDAMDFVEILVRFGFNTIVLLIIVRLLYYPLIRRRDYLFTFLMIGTIIFLLCFMLENVKLQIGMALGLFAIFGILRYRTIQISIKEMTYLFVVIGVSVINSLASKKVSYTDLLFVNAVVICMTWIAEIFLFRKPLKTHSIIYDKIELIKPEKRGELIADLECRTGLKIKRIEIGRISFLRDTVKILIFYLDGEQAFPCKKQQKNAKTKTEDETKL